MSVGSQELHPARVLGTRPTHSSAAHLDTGLYVDKGDIAPI